MLGRLYEKAFDTNQRRKACMDWHAKDTGTANLNLPHCPPTISLLYADGGFSGDGLLNYFAYTTHYHRGALQCFRKKATTGAQQCCYDYNGNLLIGQPGGV